MPRDPECPVCHLPVADSASLSSQSRRSCPFCTALFARVDGATRHARSCPKRAGRPLPSAKRGRKAKSCDPCSRVKVHCDSQNPCARCVSRSLNCAYSRYCTDATHRIEQAGSRDGRSSLPFLLKFTDTSAHFVTETLVGQEPEANVQGPSATGDIEHDVSSPHHRAETGDIRVSVLEEFIDPSILTFMPVELEDLHGAQDQDILGNLLSPHTASGVTNLSARLELLGHDLANHVMGKGRLNNAFDLIGFHTLFTASNVRAFAATFCRKRHYQFPVVHWPTLQLEKAPLPLLLSIALTGATYASHDDAEGIERARSFYHVADSYTFRRLSRVVEPDETQEEGHVFEEGDNPFDMYRAALLMYALDTLLLTDTAMRHRFMTKRLPRLAYACRRLGFVGTRHIGFTAGQQQQQHHPYPSTVGAEAAYSGSMVNGESSRLLTIDEQERQQRERVRDEEHRQWSMFLETESRIRLLTWTFLVDCTTTLLGNSPPQFTLREMCGHLPCHSALWDAASAEEWREVQQRQERRQERQQHRSAKHGGSSSDSLSLMDLMKRLMADEEPCWDDEGKADGAVGEEKQRSWGKGLAPRDVHAMALALQPIIYNFSLTFMPPSHWSIIIRALDRWDLIWAAAMREVSSLEGDDERKWLGFARNAPEVVALSRLIVASSTATKSESDPQASYQGLQHKYLQRQPRYGIDDVHMFIRDSR